MQIDERGIPYHSFEGVECEEGDHINSQAQQEPQSQRPEMLRQS